jgi:hypothetical protein
MFGRVVASVFLAGLVCTTAALAQAPPPLLAWSLVPRPVFLSLDAVQAQVDATISHAATSRVMIAAAIAQAPARPVTSMPASRR